MSKQTSKPSGLRSVGGIVVSTAVFQTGKPLHETQKMGRWLVTGFTDELAFPKEKDAGCGVQAHGLWCRQCGKIVINRV